MSPPREQRGTTYPRLVALVRRLLGPGGCDWDRAQTLASLREHTLEEAAEVIDAIDRADLPELCGELGDLLFQVVLLGEVARAEGASFGPDDVVAGIVDKLVRRHPHVFGDARPEDADWEQLKAAERQERGDTRGVVERVPAGLPALRRAQRMGERAAGVGFDWPDASGPRSKVDEELAELDATLGTGDPEQIEEELGDLLFSVVNLARHAGVDAESALRAANRKFARRFAHVERRVRDEHGGWSETALPLEALDRFWDEAKGHE